MPKLREIWLKVWPFENNSLTLYHIISFFVEPVVREVFIFLFVFSHYKSNEFFPFIIHFLVPSLTFLAIGGFTLPISGGFTLRKIGGAKLLITGFGGTSFHKSQITKLKATSPLPLSLTRV